MRTVKWNAFLSGLCGFAVALGVLAASARADVVTEKTASIIDFPKVIFNAGEDTFIQITNTGPNMLHAHCFYVDARLPEGCDREDARIGCVPIWQETDFTIWLTRQQPTHWRVSTGRPVDPSDDFSFGSNGAGLDPGAVPPVTSGFQGELLCVEVDITGSPIDGNHLKGEATLITPANSDVSKYNAIGIQSTGAANATCPNEDGQCILLLNNPRGETTGEYNACPATLVLNHFAEGTIDPVQTEFAHPGPITTELTLVPCSKDFENQQPGRVTVQFLVFNEFEERFSASFTVTCWKNTLLTDIDSPNDPTLSIFHNNNLGSEVAETRITPADQSDGGVVGVAEVFRVDNAGTPHRARAAVNILTQGDRIRGTDFAGFDQIQLPVQF